MTQVQEAKQLISQLIVKVKSLNAKNAELESELNKYSYGYVIKSEYDSLDSKYKDSLKSISDLNNKLSSINNNDYTLHNSELESAISELKNTNDALVKENKELKDKYDNLYTSYTNLSDEHTRAENAIAKLSNLRKSDIYELADIKKTLSEQNIDIARKDETIKGLNLVKHELEDKNKECFEKIYRLETSNLKSNETNDIKISAKPYKFGKTTEYIIEKVKRFIDGMYDNAKVFGENGNKEYLLNNYELVKAKENFTDREVSVFLDRLQTIKYNDTPLFYMDDNGNMASIFDGNFIKKYISTVVDN